MNILNEECIINNVSFQFPIPLSSLNMKKHARNLSEIQKPVFVQECISCSSSDEENHFFTYD